MRIQLSNVPVDYPKEELLRLFKKYDAEKLVVNPPVVPGASIVIAFVEVGDDKVDHCVKEMDKIKPEGFTNNLMVRKDPPPKPKISTPQPARQSRTHFPYTFTPRPGSNLKHPISGFHHRLESKRFDLAFEVRWTALTPVAANPVRETGVEESCHPTNSDEYKGFNRRWLMADGYPVISPFTIKGAIANGVANLLGSCYRINDRVMPHPEEPMKQGQYPYTGIWKRYRVAMDNSKPAILTTAPQAGQDEKGEHVITFKIQRVNEIYCDHTPEVTLIPKQPYMAHLDKSRHKFFIRDGSLTSKITSESNYLKEIIYHGSYTFGMNCEAPQKGKRHLHRFYQEIGDTESVTFPAERLQGEEELKKLVYMGGLSPKGWTGKSWYEDLSNLDEGSWIYYHAMGEDIVDIGKNFLFKSLFLHTDTIPAGQEPCESVKALCPRCRLFGMTDTTGDSEREADGYRGRFKSAGLSGTDKLAEPVEGETYQVQGSEPHHHVKPPVWKKENAPETILARQILLPIQGIPKANKRNKNGKGYYNQQGELHGSKQVKHSQLDLEQLIREIDRKNSENYTHKLRNWAMVCEPGMSFQGTLGLENGDLDELAALLLLLHGGSKEKNFDDGSGHGFKIGLGKSFGLGSMVSKVQTIWVRSAEEYKWEKISFTDTVDLNLENIVAQLEQSVKGISDTLHKLQNVGKAMERINSLEDYKENSLDFPDPSLKYWNNFVL